MKKILLALTLIVIALFITPFSYVIQADEDINIDTFYPNDVMEYANLSNISNVTTNDTHIAYTTNDTINIFNKDTKLIKQITNITNVLKIKFCFNNLLIAGNNTIFIVNANTLNISQMTNISYLNNAVVDFYVSEDTLKVGITETTLNVYTFNISNNEIILNNNLPTSKPLHNADHTPFALSINDNACYILSNNTNNENDDIHLCVTDINSNPNEIYENGFFKDTSILEVFDFAGNQYIAAFNKTHLFIVNSNNPTKKIIEISTIPSNMSGSVSEIRNIINNTTVDSTFPIDVISDIEIIGNNLYICDSSYNSICSFKLFTSNNNLDILSEKVLICSSNSDTGRFDNISNIFTQDNKIYVTDTNNNRIQIFNETSTSVLNNNNCDTDKIISPTSLVVDKFGKIFYISTTNQNIINSLEISKTIENTEYLITQKTTYNTTYPLGKIIQMEIDNNNQLFLLDQTNSKLHIFDTNLQYVKSSTLINIQDNAKLKYIKDINKLVLFNNGILYLLDINDISNSPQLNIGNCNSLTAGLSSIYAMTNNSLKEIKIEDNTLTLSDKTTTGNFDNYSTITLDNTTNILYCFNKNRQCLEYFSLSQEKQLPNNNDITDTTPLNEQTKPIPLTTKEISVIYEYPYNLGECYYINTTINCIGISIIDNYYKVLISYNNKLVTGYIGIDEVVECENTIDEKSVIVTHDSIPVYKYPTLLEYNGQQLTISNLTRNTIITLTSYFSCSIDDKDFYLYINNNTYGYIFSADVVLNSGNTIKYLHNENAKVKSYDNNKINVYDSDYTTIITTIDNNYRIYVKNYDKNSEWTKIIFKNSDLQEIEGYILTDHIKMDKLETSQIILIIIISLSIVILLGIIISYITIKKKK